MTERMSVDEFKRRSAKGNKYSAKAIVHNGQRFDSKLERDRHIYWSNAWACGSIAWFIRQVPFRLPGGLIYRADFLVCHHPGGNLPAFLVEDVKGYLTQVSKNKIQQVEAMYGFEVQIITKKGNWR